MAAPGPDEPISQADFADLLRRAAHDPAAQEQLCQHCAAKVRIVARVLLGPALRPHFDSLDLAQSVHRSLLMGLQSDKFDISTPEKLIALASTMVCRKVARKWRRQRRQVRVGAGGSESLAQTLSLLSSTEADPAAAAQYNDQLQRSPRLVALASARLRGQPRLLAYAEDVAISVFHTLCRGAERGRFPELANRRSLWQLLATMTVRKTIDRQRKQRRHRPPEPSHLAAVPCSSPSPAAAALSRDHLQSLLERLDEPGLRQVVEWKAAGFANEEIAVKLGCGVRTVERKLQRVRQLWRAFDAP